MANTFRAPDANVRAVIDKMTRRSLQGRETYGTTTERTDLTFEQWLLHLQGELMDGAVYIERIIRELRTNG